MVHSPRLLFLALPLLLLGAGCRPGSSTHQPDLRSQQSCALALASSSHEDIARLQHDAEKADDPSPALQKLGWKYIAKARATYDPGYYKLAEECALCMETVGSRGRVPLADA